MRYYVKVLQLNCFNFKRLGTVGQMINFVMIKVEYNSPSRLMIQDVWLDTMHFVALLHTRSTNPYKETFND